MDGIATATEALDEGRQHSPTPEAGRLGRASPTPTGSGRAPPPLARDGAAASEPDLDPPSPDAVVAVSLRHDAGPEERAREREAVLRARHAAEVARLRVALRAMEEAHAAEVARLRAEHAADTAGLRRAAEASLRAPNSERPGGGPEEGAAPGLRPRPPVAPWATTRGRLERLTGTRGGGPPEPCPGRASRPSRSRAPT
jgi:hypothetical protein